MKMDLTIEENASRLLLSGEFSLLDIVQIKADLTQALDGAQRIIIDTSGLTAIDAACLQLLHAAHLSARSKGKELEIDSSPAEVFKRQILRAGFIHQQDGGNSDKLEDFWNAGGE
jgi:anti-anti-sigma regulatory factor